MVCIQVISIIYIYCNHLFSGEPEIEPEVDLAAFLEKQRLTDTTHTDASPQDEEDEVDQTMAHITSRSQRAGNTLSRKGKVEQIEWDSEIDRMSREKAAAEATWGKSIVTSSSLQTQNTHFQDQI